MLSFAKLQLGELGNELANIFWRNRSTQKSTGASYSLSSDMRDLLNLEQHPDPLPGQIAWANQKAYQAKQHRELKAAETPVQMFLPGMEE